MKRRNFIKALGFGAAAIALMPTFSAKTILHGDGITDDTAALRALFNGQTVYYPNGQKVGAIIQDKAFVLSGRINAAMDGSLSFYGCHFAFTAKGFIDLRKGEFSFDSCIFNYPKMQMNEFSIGDGILNV